jgi:putative transposase
VVITIAGKKHWLWRDKKAAKRLLRKLLTRQARTPHLLITGKLKSYAAAKREIMLSVEHRQHKGLNNRAENPHQPKGADRPNPSAGKSSLSTNVSIARMGLSSET